MHAKLARNLKGTLESKKHFLLSGTCNDHTDYKVLCAEIKILEYALDEIIRAEAEDDE